MTTLALLGGPKAVTRAPGDIFDWPIVTEEDEEAVLGVLRAGSMSGTDITKQFEKEFADWMGMKYALACCNGTESLRSAVWACGRHPRVAGPFPPSRSATGFAAPKKATAT